MSASAIYEGTVRHRRHAEREEQFEHPIAFTYLDLDELPGLLGGRLLRQRAGLVRFRRSDYHGPPQRALSDAVRDTVERQSGVRPHGPIRLLTQLRTLGRCFNPVSFYYCLEPADPDERGERNECGERVEAVLAEVTNTPWGERRAYVLRDGQPQRSILAADFDKDLHVSPFMGMHYRYRARLGVPGETSGSTSKAGPGRRAGFRRHPTIAPARAHRTLPRSDDRPFPARLLARPGAHLRACARLEAWRRHVLPHPAGGRA